jgi:hypothetical protein
MPPTLSVSALQNKPKLLTGARNDFAPRAKTYQGCFIDGLGIVKILSIKVCGREDRAHQHARRVRFPDARRSGKQFRQNVSYEIYQAVADHVGHQIAAPQIESGEN